ncbi:hypothetical protein SFRURICE_009894 [Spodoptera frugiperda]|nr:hypothetical protein SFRURICE_009894 [Spodoptera frugiperda]
MAEEQWRHDCQNVNDLRANQSADRALVSIIFNLQQTHTKGTDSKQSPPSMDIQNTRGLSLLLQLCQNGRSLSSARGTEVNLLPAGKDEYGH